MKLVFYKGQTKFTIANVCIPNIQKLSDLINDSDKNGLTFEDLHLYDLQITSTRGITDDEQEIFDPEIAKEIEEGIDWKQVTVN